METVRLETIVTSVMPEVLRVLTPEELDVPIVLRDGMHVLDRHDVLEIVEATIHTRSRNILH
ncbi:hypothetical protein DFP93_1157 [Aneurinibacillus soli]|uniref:Uncharacterized protein n=1 Tax=Aneurinibacillus soli TaxID=1500254 RepID=A0A0U5B450_9BACL|nr:hypothetical protein [Aneurinibacillus soli]PYE59852.1 hypothetical protein DFP93_1157 [Aneurinibacillus soli]BAU29426.1 hypothetical protein CB4_03626 [Aneurinibacillus soli]